VAGTRLFIALATAAVAAGLTAAAVAVALVTPAPGGGTPPRAVVGQETSYRGWVGGIPGAGDRDRVREQGAAHRLYFRVRPRREVEYRVCLTGPSRRCWRRTTSERGRSTVEASLWLNDRGGPGEWRAVWRVRGRKVDSWRFEIRPEFG
jgi:hypothetical protein